MRDEPKLDIRMEDDGEGFEAGGRDGPTAPEEFDGVVVRAAAAQMEGEVEGAKGRKGAQRGAGLSLERRWSRASCQAWSAVRPVVRQTWRALY